MFRPYPYKIFYVKDPPRGCYFGYTFSKLLERKNKFEVSYFLPWNLIISYLVNTNEVTKFIYEVTLIGRIFPAENKKEGIFSFVSHMMIFIKQYLMEFWEEIDNI